MSDVTPTMPPILYRELFPMMTMMEWLDRCILLGYGELMIKGVSNVNAPTILTGPVPAGCRWKVVYDRVMLDGGGKVREVCGYERTQEDAGKAAESLKRSFPEIAFGVRPVEDAEETAALKRALSLSRGVKVKVALTEEEQGVSNLPGEFLATFDRVVLDAACGGWVHLALTSGAVKVRPSRITPLGAIPDLSGTLSGRGDQVTACPGCGGSLQGCPLCVKL